MNRFHRYYCGSPTWARQVATTVLPWTLKGVDLGPAALELGPGFGATTRLLARRTQHLTAIELDDQLARRLRQQLPDIVEVVTGDATAMPFEDASFTGAACLTMLHHVPSAALQDQLFNEVHRVLRPGAVFAGSDSQPSWKLRLVHLRDTFVPVDPVALPGRLHTAGFVDVHVSSDAQRVRFVARKPADG